jgi:hypothetical protein
MNFHLLFSSSSSILNNLNIKLCFLSSTHFLQKGNDCMSGSQAGHQHTAGLPQSEHLILFVIFHLALVFYFFTPSGSHIIKIFIEWNSCKMETDKKQIKPDYVFIAINMHATIIGITFK